MNTPKNIDSLIIKIRKTIRYPEQTGKKYIDTQVNRLIDNYNGDKKELLSTLLKFKDYTTSYAVNYITAHEGKFSSLVELARRSRDLSNLIKEDLEIAQDLDDLMKVMNTYGYFSDEQIKKCVHDYDLGEQFKLYGGEN